MVFANVVGRKAVFTNKIVKKPVLERLVPLLQV